MRALVTGAAGFLGRHVANAAARSGYAVAGIGHSSSSPIDLAEWGISDWWESDVTLEALESHVGAVDVIFHCAGGASVAASLEDPYRDFHRTVDPTLAVLEFIRRRSTGIKLILTSSAGVYGKVGSAPLSIGSQLAPVSPYGMHKKIAEDLCRSYGHSFGVSSSIVRLFSVYGPDLRKQLLWDACRRLIDGDNQFSGTGEETRDWLHVADAAALLLTAVQYASPAAPTVNGGTGISVPVKEIVEAVGNCLVDVDAPQFSGAKRGGDPDHYQADLTEAHAWGWTPRRPWREGVSEYVAWYLGAAR